jgi:hypothetical protein
VVVNPRASVTAGFANDVDDVNPVGGRDGEPDQPRQGLGRVPDAAQDRQQERERGAPFEPILVRISKR